MTSPGPGYNYVALRELRINNVIAFEPGQWVPDSTIATQGWSVGSDISAPGPITPTTQTLTSANFGAYAAPVAPARLAPGLLYGFMGDSITNGSNAGNFSYSFAPQAVAMAGGLVARPDSFTAGVPGQTSAQMLARMNTFLGYGPTAMVLLAGTNDAGNAVPLSTYIANMTAMIQQAKAAGLPVIICTVPPRGSSAAAALHQATAAENAWIHFYAPTLGCEIANTYAALVDPTTGYLAAAYDSGDATHPNGLGHQKMAVEVAKAMKRVNARFAYNLITSVLPSGNLISDPLCAGGTTQPAGWFEWPGGSGTAPTYSLVSDTSGVLPAGRWAQMDFDGTSSGGVRRLSSGSLSTGFSVGDTLALVCTTQIEDTSGTWQADVVAGTAAVVPTVINQSGAAVSGLATYSRCAGVKNASGFYDIGPSFYPFVVPTGTTSMNMWHSLVVPTGKHYKMRVGCIGVLNLTTLGLAGSSVLGWGNATVAH